MTSNGSNCLYCQVDAIARFATSPFGKEEDIGALHNLCLKLQQADSRIKREIERRLDAGQTAGQSRWS